MFRDARHMSSLSPAHRQPGALIVSEWMARSGHLIYLWDVMETQAGVTRRERWWREGQPPVHPTCPPLAAASDPGQMGPG